MHAGSNRDRCLIVLLALVVCSRLYCEQWVFLGPNGGDARSLAYDPENPDHLFLGTSTGTIFTSTDGGGSWSRFAHLGEGDNFVLDHIVIDPRNPKVLFVSAWNVEDQQSGEIFRSRDGGVTWEAVPGMHRKPIRALTMAASDSRVLVAGALDGVYRSDDAGDSWQRISPSNNPEIKNIESVAIRPDNSKIIYAGTWHLAWKTTDNGVSWRRMNKGMEDDSDVFSIMLDLADPAIVFASACSGIYKSENAGEDFHKIQGIPFSARRTRVLKQDPSTLRIVYAGTTQGLWKSTDGAKTWKPMGRPELVVNDVFVDPRNPSRLLLATDRSGVMKSENGGLSFSTSNHGYTHRYITTLLHDNRDPGKIYVGIANDLEWGGVFSLRLGSEGWQQKSMGLEGRDVLVLKQTANGALIAGTNRGIFMLDAAGSRWRSNNNIQTEQSVSRVRIDRLGTHIVDPPMRVPSLIDARVNDIEIGSEAWFAATSNGLFISRDNGKSWNGGLVAGRTDFLAVRNARNRVVAATETEVFASADEGNHWEVVTLPSKLSGVCGIAVTSDAEILIASSDHVFRSSDGGATWENLAGIRAKNFSSISYEESKKAVVVTSLSTGAFMESYDGGRTWSRSADVGYPLRRIKVLRGRLVAVTLFDGVIVQQ